MRTIYHGLFLGTDGYRFAPYFADFDKNRNNNFCSYRWSWRILHCRFSISGSSANVFM
nr:hypothetical protein [Sedimentibacter sp.]